MEKNIDNNRIIVYDWVRLIATFYVIIGHSMYLNISTAYGGVMYTYPQNVSILSSCMPIHILQRASVWVYGFHMQLFFILSGAVMSIKTVNKTEFILQRRVKRLILPYIFYGMFFMLPIKYLFGFYQQKKHY